MFKNIILTVQIFFGLSLASFLCKATSFNTDQLQKIDNYQLPTYVLKRYEKDFNVSKEIAEQHAKELKRYFVLSQTYPQEKFPLFSQEVDNLWHTFLLFTRDYQDFCQTLFGKFLHHEPFDSHEDFLINK